MPLALLFELSRQCKEDGKLKMWLAGSKLPGLGLLSATGTWEYPRYETRAIILCETNRGTPLWFTNLTQLKQKFVEKYPALFVECVQCGAGIKWSFIFWGCQYILYLLLICELSIRTQVQKNSFQRWVCTSGICMRATLFFRPFQVLFPRTNAFHFMNNTLLRGYSIPFFHISNSILKKLFFFFCCW